MKANSELSEDNVLMYSVTVKMIDIKWLSYSDTNFLDLVEILNQTKNNAIIQTNFVSLMLCQFWD